MRVVVRQLLVQSYEVCSQGSLFIAWFVPLPLAASRRKHGVAAMAAYLFPWLRCLSAGCCVELVYCLMLIGALFLPSLKRENWQFRHSCSRFAHCSSFLSRLELVRWWFNTM